MNLKIPIATLCLLLSVPCSFAQAQKEKMTREEKQEKIDARATRIKDRADYALFRRQMLALKEYQDERKKIPALQKQNKAVVKVLAVVDSLDDAGDNPKTLSGYIRQDIGGTTANVYEVTFDRARKAITAVKPTGESTEPEKEEKAEKKPVQKKTEKTIKKKNADDDGDDDEEQEKPSRKTKKTTTDDDE